MKIVKLEGRLGDFIGIFARCGNNLPLPVAASTLDCTVTEVQFADVKIEHWSDILIKALRVLSIISSLSLSRGE